MSGTKNTGPQDFDAGLGYQPAWMVAALRARPGSARPDETMRVWQRDYAALTELYYQALPLAAEQVDWWRSEGHGPGIAWLALRRPVPLRPDWGGALHLLACRWAAMMLLARIDAEGEA